MKRLFILTVAILSSITMRATKETTVFRIKGMRCEECAHKVTTVVKQLNGIERMDFNLERRTVAISYDPALTCADTIKARLDRTGRYKTLVYNPTEVIKRGIGLRMDDMHCQRCVDRITRRLGTILGVDSIGPNLDKHYVFIRYDANRTSQGTIREALLDLGFTPVSYYTSKNISFVYYNLPQQACTDAVAESLLALDGVDDVCVNPKRGTLAITYVNTETDANKLLHSIKAEGIEATIPTGHACKEE